MRRIPLILLSVLAVAGCSRPQVVDESPAPLPTAPAAARAAKCTGPGQFWARRGLAGETMCVTPYPDAGKACSDKNDCAGRCIADYDDVRGRTSGSAAVGKCQTDNALFGCYAEVVQGRLTQRICVD